MLKQVLVPNPRLQRTPSAPLSRQPLGAATMRVGRARGETMESCSARHPCLPARASRPTRPAPPASGPGRRLSSKAPGRMVIPGTRWPNHESRA